MKRYAASPGPENNLSDVRSNPAKKSKIASASAAAEDAFRSYNTGATDLIVSDFLEKSCWHHPKPNMHKFNSLPFLISAIHDMKSEWGDRHWCSMSSGSGSEFYIDPMVPCVGDIDLMYSALDQLAIPSGCPVPDRLPEGFARQVEIYEMVDTQFPCYIVLRCAYRLSKCAEGQTYACTTFFSDVRYLRIGLIPDLVDPAVLQSLNATDGDWSTPDATRHGPALMTDNAFGIERNFKLSRMSMDLVRFIRCPVWPPQADSWLTRPRTHGWPDEKAIENIVGYGCDVVQVQHPLCKDDEPKKQIQWRLSFSKAETVLLNSWSPKQQLVYHLLRIFVKSLQGERVITQSYHIKTLMLWTSEMYTQHYWNTTCLVNICTPILHTMADWLSSKEYRMYFAQECNLFHNILGDCDNLIASLFSVTDESISDWFSSSYIRQGIEPCPPEIARKLNKACTPAALRVALASIVDWRALSSGEASCRNIEQACYDLQFFFSEMSPSAHECQQFIEQLITIDERLTAFFLGVTLLHTARQFDLQRSAKRTADKVLVVLRMSDKYFGTRKGKSIDLIDLGVTGSMLADNRVGNLVFSAGTDESRCDLMKNASSLLKTDRLLNKSKLSLEAELARFYLNVALRCKPTCDTCSKTSDCALIVYLACFHYKTKAYRQAVNCCVSATLSAHQPDSYLPRKMLPQVHEDIENVLGIILLYQFLLPEALRDLKESRSPVDAFNARPLAHYLLVQSLNAAHEEARCISQQPYLDQYTACLRNTGNLLLADVLLCHATRENDGRKKAVAACPAAAASSDAAARTDARLATFSTNGLRHQLLQSAVQKLAAFRLMTARDFRSVRTIVTTDYQALFAYKCGSYRRCLILSMSNIAKLMHEKATSTFTVPSDMLLLLDDECVSVLGLATLCNALDVEPLEWETVNQLVISVYLVAQCKLNLGYDRLELSDLFCGIKLTHRKCHIENFVNRSLMVFVYRKVVRKLLERRSVRPNTAS